MKGDKRVSGTTVKVNLLKYCRLRSKCVNSRSKVSILRHPIAKLQAVRHNVRITLRITEKSEREIGSGGVNSSMCISDSDREESCFGFKIWRCLRWTAFVSVFSSTGDNSFHMWGELQDSDFPSQMCKSYFCHHFIFPAVFDFGKGSKCWPLLVLFKIAVCQGLCNPRTTHWYHTKRPHKLQPCWVPQKQKQEVSKPKQVSSDNLTLFWLQVTPVCPGGSLSAKTRLWPAYINTDFPHRRDELWVLLVWVLGRYWERGRIRKLFGMKCFKLPIEKSKN